jgi:esterase/lipase
MRFLDRYMVRLSWWSLKKIYRVIIIVSMGALFVGLIAFYLYMRSLPTLSTWHTTILENEFTTHSKIKNITEYMVLEEKLFTELDIEIYDKTLPSEHKRVNRYTNDSIANPKRWMVKWNKSFELPVANPKGAVLLLHGMSDSPYSLHTQAEYLHENGFWVLGLRMPGHGTIPSGLRNMKWQDMAAVVELGMKHLEKKLGSKPIHIMGYSTGAPLALNYTLKALEEKSKLRIPDSLLFYSPAIGVSAAAPLAVWQSRVGYLLGLPKLEWNSLLPEYDPFKYGSFAVNAGDQVYRLAKAVQKQFDKLEKHPSTKTFPPVISFSSIVDSTVSVPAVVDNLFNRLPKGKHTLVFFDINHNFDRNHLVKSGLSTKIQILRDTAIHENYTFELISNMHTKSRSVERIVNHTKPMALPYQWSKGLYSLSHLAMPISPNDPLYGNADAPKSPGIQLGHLAIYGETGVLQISSASLLRQRWNPFHSYIKQRVLAFLEPKN